MALRFALFTYLAASLTIAAAPAIQSWKTGSLTVEEHPADGRGGYRDSPVDTLHHGNGDQYLPSGYLTLIIDVASPRKVYRAEMTEPVNDPSVSYYQVFPWLATTPQRVHFQVKGKTLYYTDANQQTHKAHIIHVTVTK